MNIVYWSSVCGKVTNISTFIGETLAMISYLIPDAVRGRYWAIRYSWNIMPVWNNFVCLADPPYAAGLYSIVHVARPLLDVCIMSQHVT